MLHIEKKEILVHKKRGGKESYKAMSYVTWLAVLLFLLFCY